MFKLDKVREDSPSKLSESRKMSKTTLKMYEQQEMFTPKKLPMPIMDANQIKVMPITTDPSNY